jgi:hypothetical protein
MKKILLGAVAALFVLPAQADGPRDRVRADSVQDSKRHRRTPPNTENTADTPSEADVGDADSFGRPVKYLGFAQSGFAAVQPDCTGQVPGTCVTQTDPTTNASVTVFATTAVVRLPGRAAKSLLCFSLTPQGSISYSNQTAQPQNVDASLYAVWRIESEVLNDPSLIDPATGAPYNGVMTSGTGLEYVFRNALPGERETRIPTSSRSCISGHLSRRALIGQGLSDSQAREFFRKPITIRFGARATGGNADVISGYGVRIYGD